MALIQLSLTRTVHSSIGHKLRTFSIGFEHTDYDEAPLSLNLAKSLHTEHYSITFSAADFDDYPQVMHHLEEPQAAATALPIFKLYQACRKAGLTVVLTGEGADELLGGYHWHQGDALVRPLLGLPQRLRYLIAGLPLPMSTAARRVLARGAADVPTRYRDWLELDGSNYHLSLLSADIQHELKEHTKTFKPDRWANILHSSQAKVPLHQTLWLEAQTRMVDFINFEVDKMSMANSIEARVPYLDHHLWEFCATLPAHYKLKGRIEKHLLRLATRDILPDSTRLRRKKGLASPYAHWLKAKRLPEWAEQALLPTVLRQVGLFEPASVSSLRQAHQAGQPNLSALLMAVLSTQVWYQTFCVEAI